MKIKHIRWIAIIGLVAIVELQYVWLVNTYKLTRESVLAQNDECFRNAVLAEAFLRIRRWDEQHSPKDSVVSVAVKPQDADTLNYEQIKGDANRWLNASFHTAFQEKILKQFHIDVSLEDVDSIYRCLLDSVGISASVMSYIMDGNDKLLQTSPHFRPTSEAMLKTAPIALDYEGMRFLQGAILNPYWAVFQRMTLLLIATVLIMVLVIVCLVWQLRMIVRQDKIARVREDFSYALIHDMKTPLSSILMGTQVLQTGRLDDRPEVKERYFRILKEEGEHLLALIDRVLTLSKLENHQLKLMKETCSLRRMLEDLAEKFQAKSEKEVTFCWQLEVEEVYADEEFLKEALSNLIDNAIKYSGGAVKIVGTSEYLPGNRVAIRIRDNGMGIPLKDQSRIFEKYERAAAASRTRHGGAPGFGLGLNYVLRVAEAHGGCVTVESIEGVYSEFTLLLPMEETVKEIKSTDTELKN